MALQDPIRQQVGLVDVLAGQRGQLWTPQANILTVPVIPLRLRDDVEDPVTRVAADASDILPVSPVAGRVVVNEHRLEVGRAPAPVDLEGAGQEAGDVLAPPVGHEPGRAQLAHVGVDKRHPGLPTTPARKQRPVLAPGVVSAADAAALEQPGADSGSQEAKVVSPDQLKDEPVGRVVLHTLALVFANLLPDPTGRDAASGQPWRELCGVVRADQTVAGLLVAGDRIALPEVGIQPRHRRVFSPLKGHHAARV